MVQKTMSELPYLEHRRSPDGRELAVEDHHGARVVSDPDHRLDEEAVHPALDVPVVDRAGDVPALVLEREPAVDDQVVVDLGGKLVLDKAVHGLRRHHPYHRVEAVVCPRRRQHALGLKT